MSADLPFDRSLRRMRRDRAAKRGASADYLQRLMAEELVERLSLVKRDFAETLCLGGGKHLLSALGDRGGRIVAADPGFAFASAGGGVQCHEDRLPFADRSFDLILSAGLLDTVNDLPGALILIRRALRPEGLFLGCFFGAGSLPRLREAMLAADAASGGASPRVHPQIDVRAAGDLLGRAGFHLPVADSFDLEVRFPDLLTLVSDLRAMAATNILAARGGPLTRKGLQAASHAFASAAGADGKTGETFSIVFVTGWAPPQ